jgi:TP901 family phage tail tape measure protein
MSTALQQLDFVISLVDRVSGPAGKIMKTMDQVTTNVQAGYRKIGYGAAGLFGAGYALDRLITPAKELDRALGEVASLDVANDVLEDLTQSALRFSTQYGESAQDFVRSSYDIQSAINGLVGNELGTFTEASAILAKGTKADVGVITDYVGTMYGIFKNSADQMGKGEWVQMLTGQTAQAVQIFKTTGAEMSSSFTTLGASAQSHGVAMGEQIAILGQLQSTMSGSEAGTKYKSFLAGVGKAQDTLGLQFTDSQGRMLPMIDILTAIQGKFGDLDTVAESDLLQKAFGRKEAVDLIKLLSADIDGLSDSINAVGSQSGMDKAIDMANAIKDPFEIAGKQIEALQITLGKVLIPQLLPFLSAMGEGANKLLEWSTLFPNITKLLGAVLLTTLGVVAAISALSIAVGISKFLLVGWTAAVAILKFVLGPIPYLFGIARLGMSMWMVQMSLGKGVIASTTAALRVMMVTMKLNTLQTKFGTAVMFVWKTAALVATGAMKALNLAMKMNPISLIVIGVAALAYGLYKLADHFGVFDALKDKVKNLKAWFDSFNLVESLLNGVDWLIDKINLIPGINIGNSDAAAPSIAVPSSTRESYQPRVRGGVINRISQANNTNSQSMGDVIVNNYGDRMDGFDLREQLAMGG